MQYDILLTAAFFQCQHQDKSSNPNKLLKISIALVNKNRSYDFEMQIDSQSSFLQLYDLQSHAQTSPRAARTDHAPLPASRPPSSPFGLLRPCPARLPREEGGEARDSAGAGRHRHGPGPGPAPLPSGRGQRPLHGNRLHPLQGSGLSPKGRVPRRRLREKGPAPVHHRPRELRGRCPPAGSPVGHGQDPLRPGRARLQALGGPGRLRLGQPRGLRAEAPGARHRRRHHRLHRGQPGLGPQRAHLLLHHLAHRGPGRLHHLQHRRLHPRQGRHPGDREPDGAHRRGLLPAPGGAGPGAAGPRPKALWRSWPSSPATTRRPWAA